MTLNELIEVCDAERVRCTVPIGRSLKATVECNVEDDRKTTDLLLAYGNYHVHRVGVFSRDTLDVSIVEVKQL